MDWYNPTCYAFETLDAKYGQVSMGDVVDQLTHLKDKQKQDLKALLKDFTRLFDGTLGVCPHKKFHINLVPGARSKHSQPYAIPCIHLVAFKEELERLVQIGVVNGAHQPLSLQKRTSLFIGSATYEN
jgi:hypothetical protein